MNEGLISTTTEPPSFSKPDVAGTLPPTAEKGAGEASEGATETKIDDEQERKMTLLRQLKREEIQIKILIDEVTQRNTKGSFAGDIATLNGQLADVRSKMGSLGMDLAQKAAGKAVAGLATGDVLNATGAILTGVGTLGPLAEEGV